MGIVTKTGDKGRTCTCACKDVSKADLMIELIGDVDELNAQAGFARSMLRGEGLSDIAADVRRLQLALFRIGAEISMGAGTTYDEAIAQKDIELIEGRIAELEAEVDLPKSFLLPGTTPAASAIEVARAVARRVERQAVRAKEAGLIVNEHVCVWLNRASDHLFMLARAAEAAEGIEFDRID
jgi:cob(I)alamin adenosyltransferase